MNKISVLNQSTVVTDAWVENYVPRQQMQITRDLLPIWGVYGKVEFIPTGTTPDPSSWQLVFLDNSDQADALGYHDLTASNLPLAKIFCKTTTDDGGNISVTASHEICEMLVDPWINLTAYDNNTKFYAYEVCDAVEDDSLAYEIGGYMFSDFVLPNWFEPTTPGSATGRFSFKENVHAPFTLAKGGYISYLDITNSSAGWQQITNADKPKFSRRLTQRMLNFKKYANFGR